MERWKLWKTAATFSHMWSMENLTLDVLQRVGEPVESLVQSLAVGGAGGLDVPVPVPHVLQAQLLGQLRRLQSVRKILFVGEYKQDSISEFIFAQHSCKFVSCLANTISIIGINNENQSLGVLEIVSPNLSLYKTVVLP